MKNCAVVQDLFSNEHGSVSNKKEYHSAEFCIKGLDYSYQFKLRRVASGPMQILIKQDSAILNRLEAGGKYNIKYYSNESACPISFHETIVKHVIKAEDGRFKGHYLVGLAITEGADDQEIERSSKVAEGPWS